MKSMIIVALALVAVAVAVPVEEPVKILKSNFDQEPAGPYAFGFEAENGIVRQETGELRQAVDEENKPHDVIVVRGSYSYPSADAPNGVETINYFADETGYHAEGPSVPKAERR